jgi:hypothetical protein
MLSPLLSREAPQEHSPSFGPGFERGGSRPFGYQEADRKSEIGFVALSIGCLSWFVVLLSLRGFRRHGEGTKLGHERYLPVACPVGDCSAPGRRSKVPWTSPYAPSKKRAEILLVLGEERPSERPPKKAPCSGRGGAKKAVKHRVNDECHGRRI